MSLLAATSGPALGAGTTASGRSGCCERQRWRSCSASVRGQSGSGPGGDCCRRSGPRGGSTASQSVPCGSCSIACARSPASSTALAATAADTPSPLSSRIRRSWAPWRLVHRPGPWSGADGEAGGGEALLDLGDGELAEVEDAGGQHGVGAGLAGGDEMVDAAGAAAGDHGDVDGAHHGGDQLQVVAGLLPVGVHAGDQELAGAAAGALLGPGQGVASG